MQQLSNSNSTLSSGTHSANSFAPNRPIPTYFAMPSQSLPILAQFPQHAVYAHQSSSLSLLANGTSANEMISLPNLQYALSSNATHPQPQQFLTQYAQLHNFNSINSGNVGLPTSAWICAPNSTASQTSVHASPTALVNYAAIAGLLGLSQTAQLNATSSALDGSIPSFNNKSDSKSHVISSAPALPLGTCPMNLPIVNPGMSASSLPTCKIESETTSNTDSVTRNELENALKASLSDLQHSLKSTNPSQFSMISHLLSSDDDQCVASIMEQFQLLASNANGSMNFSTDPIMKATMLKMILFTLTSINHSHLKESERKDLLIEKLRAEMRSKEETLKKEIESVKHKQGDQHDEEDGPCPHCHSEKKGTRWSTADDEAMVAMIKSGKDYEEIAKQLRRTVRALKDRYCYLKKLFSNRRSSSTSTSPFGSTTSSTRNKHSSSRKKRKRNSADHDADTLSDTESENGVTTPLTSRNKKIHKSNGTAVTHPPSKLASPKLNNSIVPETVSAEDSSGLQTVSTAVVENDSHTSHPYSPLPVLTNLDEDSDSGSSFTSSPSQTVETHTLEEPESTSKTNVTIVKSIDSANNDFVQYSSGKHNGLSSSTSSQA